MTSKIRYLPIENNGKIIQLPQLEDDELDEQYQEEWYACMQRRSLYEMENS